MKLKALFWGFLSTLTLYAQDISYHLTGYVDLVAKNYDFPVIFTRNAMADLQLFIYKNGVEYGKSGPHKNSNSETFQIDKMQLNATDTIRVDCYDVDENNIFTFGLNSDDFICTYSFIGNQLINSGRYTDTISNTGNKLTISAIPYYNANISILSFKRGGTISNSEWRMIKKGLAWKPKYMEDFRSSLEKVKKGVIVWKDTFSALVYNNMMIEMTTKTFYEDTWIDFNISVKPGIQEIYTSYGAFTVEITPLE